MEVREAIEQVEAFGSLNTEALDRLEQVAQEVHFPAGTAIIREGESGDAFFIVLDGELEIQTVDFAEVTQEVARLGAGSVFGEGAALTGEPRSATVLAANPVVALRFEMVSVLTVLEDFPEAIKDLRRLALLRAEELVQSVMDR